MKVGDLVLCWPHGSKDISMAIRGIIVSFEQPGNGGKDFVDVLCDGQVLTFMSFDIEVISE